MKHLINLSMASLLLCCSCGDILDKDPYDSIPEERVWGDVGQSNLYLNNLYSFTLPGFSAGGNAGNSDEVFSGNDLIYGLLNDESEGTFSADTYARIRKINILLERMGTTGYISQKDEEQIKGQAYFLRAWIYWGLVNLYGGVPMVTNVQSLSVSGEPSPEILVRRNKTRDCIDTIVRDLDLAAKYLPAKWSDADYGRITRGAAMAFKGRILLFWASPQFNPFNMQDRWQRAYDANASAIDTLKKDGHGLHPSFVELFTDCKEKTSEAIFVRVYDANVTNGYHAYDNGVRPAAASMSGGGTNNQPTWNLVQSFPMNNGYYPTRSPEDSIAGKYNFRRFWMNRDPRFYATVAYNGCVWPLSGVLDYKVWTYRYRKYDTNGTLSYVGTEGSSNVATQSGFYCRKYVNPKIAAANTTKIGTDWMEIRYAEVLLNLAECANELDKRQEAYDIIKAIRDRAWNDPSRITSPMWATVPTDHMGHITAAMPQLDMREAIIRERQVELAFENKRYWDMRRRNMFVDDLGTIKALNGTYRMGRWEILDDTKAESDMLMFRDGVWVDGTTNLYDRLNHASNDIGYNNFFAPGMVQMDTKQTVDYPQPKYNFFAIQQTNLDKNLNLEQTSYWGGTFDPLAE
jgi:hypothetical protein